MIKYNTLPTLFTSDMFKEMDRFLGGLDFFNIQEARQSLKSHPRGDIVVDKEGSLVVELALAGYSRDQLSVSVCDNELVVSAQKSVEENKGSLARRAFRKVLTDFERVWDLNNAEVVYKDGLLKVIVKPLSRQTNSIKALEIK